MYRQPARETLNQPINQPTRMIQLINDTSCIHPLTRKGLGPLRHVAHVKVHVVCLCQNIEVDVVELEEIVQTELSNRRHGACSCRRRRRFCGCCEEPEFCPLVGCCTMWVEWNGVVVLQTDSFGCTDPTSNLHSRGPNFMFVSDSSVVVVTMKMSLLSFPFLFYLVLSSHDYDNDYTSFQTRFISFLFILCLLLCLFLFFFSLLIVIVWSVVFWPNVCRREYLFPSGC